LTYPTTIGDAAADILPIEREALIAVFGSVFEEHRPAAPPAGPPAEDNPPAATAGEEDHTNPWFHAGESADAPADDEQADEPGDDEPAEPSAAA
jgi:hypothetical protein